MKRWLIICREPWLAKIQRITEGWRLYLISDIYMTFLRLTALYERSTGKHANAKIYIVKYHQRTLTSEEKNEILTQVAMTGKGILHSWTYDITDYYTSLFMLKVNKPWHVWNWMRFVPEGFKCWKLSPSVDDYGIVELC